MTEEAVFGDQGGLWELRFFTRFSVNLKLLFEKGYWFFLEFCRLGSS